MSRIKEAWAVLRGRSSQPAPASTKSRLKTALSVHEVQPSDVKLCSTGSISPMAWIKIGEDVTLFIRDDLGEGLQGQLMKVKNIGDTLSRQAQTLMEMG